MKAPLVCRDKIALLDKQLRGMKNVALAFSGGVDSTFLLAAAKNAGLETLRVFTPGVLDLDIMKNNRAKVTDRFWTSVLDASDEVELSRWQQFISDSGRSSHMWAVLQKP